MKIVCAETVLLGQDAFQTVGETVVIPDREITHADLLDADALVIRSKTKATAKLLEGTPVQFVGTATAGTDHFDTAWLSKRGIYHCAAPGCNANSVSEYLVAALLSLRSKKTFDLAGKTLGVIGCGNVGRRVVHKAEALGMNVLRNDPPLEAAGLDPDFVSLDELLENSDIVSLHVPLVNEKPWPTFKMADYLFFEKLKPGAIFINASRGSVADYDALMLAKESGVVSRMVIDVWDPEPAFRTDVLQMADIATAHIAGHSYEGKLNGTVDVYNQLCNFFEIEKKWDIQASLPAADVPEVTMAVSGREDEDVLHEIIQRIYPIDTDDANLREAAVASTADRSANFDALRKNYRVRREFHNTTIVAEDASPSLRKKLRGLGFQVA